MIIGPFTGGCLCKSIRYEVYSIFDVIYCHCNQCRPSSGAPVLVTAAVAGDAFRVTEGTPNAFATSATGRSLFRGKCGSGLWGEYLAENHPLARDGK